MPLVSLKSVLEGAEKEGYGVGAFNCHNLEFIQAILKAAELEAAPVIIQASQGAIKYAGLDYVASLVKVAASSTFIPVVLHLDHGTDFVQVMRALRAGFTSVMFDGSCLPLEENIALTKKVVEVAHAMGVSVEGELGRIPGTEEHITVSAREAFFTDPQEAAFFVEETGVDALAVSVGTAHGIYQGPPEIDFQRLKELKEKVPVPLVLHGASGVPDGDLQRAVTLGVRKVNIDTDIRTAFVLSLRKTLAAAPQEIDPRKILGPAREAAVEVIRHKIRTLGSSGRIKEGFLYKTTPGDLP
ncbi:MAG TPA: class II fructose-1,6-bisphosphate aldolase [Moorella mulderi]|nr:class II fructose-1,6-bisphosphate aldolase [Moorella mulderi]